MPELSVEADKQRLVTQLQVNLQNMPDEPHEVAHLLPQLRAQAQHVIEQLSPSDFRPAELMALLSLVGPVLARTPVTTPKAESRILRIV